MINRILMAILCIALPLSIAGCHVKGKFTEMPSGAVVGESATTVTGVTEGAPFSPEIIYKEGAPGETVEVVRECMMPREIPTAETTSACDYLRSRLPADADIAAIMNASADGGVANSTLWDLLKNITLFKNMLENMPYEQCYGELEAAIKCAAVAGEYNENRVPSVSDVLNDLRGAQGIIFAMTKGEVEGLLYDVAAVLPFTSNPEFDEIIGLLNPVLGEINTRWGLDTFKEAGSALELAGCQRNEPQSCPPPPRPSDNPFANILFVLTGPFDQGFVKFIDYQSARYSALISDLKTSGVLDEKGVFTCTGKTMRLYSEIKEAGVIGIIGDKDDLEKMCLKGEEPLYLVKPTETAYLFGTRVYLETAIPAFVGGQEAGPGPFEAQFAELGLGQLKAVFRLPKDMQAKFSDFLASAAGVGRFGLSAHADTDEGKITWDLKGWVGEDLVFHNAARLALPPDQSGLNALLLERCVRGNRNNLATCCAHTDDAAMKKTLECTEGPPPSCPSQPPGGASGVVPGGPCSEEGAKASCVCAGGKSYDITCNSTKKWPTDLPMPCTCSQAGAATKQCEPGTMLSCGPDESTPDTYYSGKCDDDGTWPDGAVDHLYICWPSYSPSTPPGPT